MSNYWYSNPDWWMVIATSVTGIVMAIATIVFGRKQYRLSKEQKRLQEEQNLQTRAAQVARLKNILCDIQQHSDCFLSNALSSIRFIDIRTREAIYRDYSQRYDLLNNLRNELIRENRFATILATSKEYKDCKKDLDAMIQLQLQSWYNLSTIVMRVPSNDIQKVYANSYQRHTPDNKEDNPQAQYKVLNDILALNPENPYMAGFTFAEFLGACQKVFHTNGDNIFQTIDKIVEQKTK